MRNKPWFSLLGLANRAGKVVSGESQVIGSVRKGHAAIILLAADASERTLQTWLNKSAFYDIPLKTVPDRFILGEAIGKEHRVVVAVNDKGFSRKLTALLDQSRG